MRSYQGEPGGWDAFWEREGDKSSRGHPKLVDTICALVGCNGQRMLEIGGGRGTDGMALAEKGAHVVLLDYSERALAIAKAACQGKGLRISLVCADAHHLPFSDESFDVVFHQGFLEHFRSVVPLIEEQCRALKPCGLLLVDVPQRFNPYTLIKKIKLFLGRWKYGWEAQFSFHELKALMEDCSFEVIYWYGYGYDGWLIDRLRLLHLRGTHRFGAPIMPARLGRAYDGLWMRLENSPLARWKLAMYLWRCIGIVGRKRDPKEDPCPNYS